jgi:hypothetical protein
MLTVFPRNLIPSSESRTEPCINISKKPDMDIIYNTDLPNKSIYASCTTINLVECNFTEDLAAMLSI